MCGLATSQTHRIIGYPAMITNLEALDGGGGGEECRMSILRNGKVGLYTPTILGGKSYLSWFYDRGAIKDPAHTGTSKGLSQAINRGTTRKFLPKYANVYVTIQGLSAGARSHYVTANGVRNGLSFTLRQSGKSCEELAGGKRKGLIPRGDEIREIRPPTKKKLPMGL